jgi:hypothetical protein
MQADSMRTGMSRGPIVVLAIGVCFVLALLTEVP